MSISELVLGCRDPELLGRFWCEVLDFVVLDRLDDGTLEIGPPGGFGGPQPTIILSWGEEPEPGQSRLHHDVNATDREQDAELERLLRLGARPADIGQTGTRGGTSWLTPRATSSACSQRTSTHSEALERSGCGVPLADAASTSSDRSATSLVPRPAP